MELFHPTSGQEDTNLSSHDYATARKQINQKYQDLCSLHTVEIPELHSQLLKCLARCTFIALSAEQHILLPLLCVKQREDMFARHEALFNITHFQVVQRKHILLLFFLGKTKQNRLNQPMLCDKSQRSLIPACSVQSAMPLGHLL